MATIDTGSGLSRQPGDQEHGNLVLWLAVGKRIVIDGGRIVLTGVDSGARGMKIAIEAPKNVSIDRQEVHDDKIRREFFKQ